jgi:hypothetical protein
MLRHMLLAKRLARGDFGLRVVGHMATLVHG